MAYLGLHSLLIELHGLELSQYLRKDSICRRHGGSRIRDVDNSDLWARDVTMLIVHSGHNKECDIFLSVTARCTFPRNEMRPVT